MLRHFKVFLFLFSSTALSASAQNWNWTSDIVQISGAEVSTLQSSMQSHKLNFSHKKKLSQSWSWTTDADARFLQLSSQTGARQTESQLQARDVSLSYSAQKTSFVGKAGLFFEKWGSTDVVNPLDRLSSKSFLFTVSPEVLTDPTLKLGWLGANHSYELFFVPKRSVTQFPNENSAFLPRRQFYDEVYTLQPDAFLEYKYTEAQELGNPRANNVGFKYSGFFRNGEWALYYYEGLRQIPYLKPKVVSGLPNGNIIKPLAPIELQRIESREQMSGLSASFAVGDTLLKYAGTVTKPSEEKYFKPSTEEVFSVEQPWSLSKNFSSLQILQYYLVRPDSELTNNSLSISALLGQKAMWLSRWSYRESWRFTAGITLAESGLWLTQVEKVNSSHWTTSVSAAQFYVKQEQSNLKYLDKKSLVLLSLKYSL